MTAIPKVTLEQRHDGIFTLLGEVTYSTVEVLLKLDKKIFQSTVKDNVLLVDCSHISHMDSAGVAYLIELIRTAKKQGKLIKFKQLPSQAQAIIKASHLQELLISQ